MKQKVVIQVCMNDQKSRKKALKIVVCQSGVISAAIKGQDKNEIEVIGEGVDAVGLTTAIRKNMASAELISVGPAGGKASGGEEGAPATLQHYGVPLYHHVYEVREQCHPACAIM